MLNVEEGDVLGAKRNLEVTNRLVVPVNIPFRLVVTSGDVLHSFALPEFAIKMDAVPGRLNSVLSFITKPGVFYGQCSELCGVGHGFMPICVEAVSYDVYIDYLTKLYVILNNLNMEQEANNALAVKFFMNDLSNSKKLN